MKKNTLLALVSVISAITLFAIQVKAEEKEYVERFSIEGGVGTNSILSPFVHGRVSYLLPTIKNNFKLNIDYSFLSYHPVFLAFSNDKSQSLSLELNYYFFEKNFLNIGVNHFSIDKTSAPPREEHLYFANKTALSVGIGTDLMISKNFGFSTQINVLPVAWDHQNNIIKWDFNIRPEVNLKLLF